MTDLGKQLQPKRWRDVAFAVRWRIAAGWVVVAVLLLHYFLFPIANVLVQAYGLPPLAPLDPMSWEDVLAIVGLPVGGAYADRLKDS